MASMGSGLAIRETQLCFNSTAVDTTIARFYTSDTLRHVQLKQSEGGSDLWCTDPMATVKPSTARLLWLVGSLFIGYLIGNIVFGLPFTFILFFGVPDNRWTAKYYWWRKISIPVRAMIVVALLYLSMVVMTITLGPWLTSGMGK